MKHKTNLKARYDERSRRYAYDGKPRSGKRDNWKSAMGWWH